MNALLRHPFLVGWGSGLTLALAVALLASDAELKPAYTRPIMAVLVAAFFVPASIATFSVARAASSAPEGKTLLRLLCPLAAVCCSLVMGLAAVSDWKDVRRYAREGREVAGEVVDSQPQNHNMLVVRYALAGASYQRMVAAPGNARNYTFGEPITVYYFGSAPGEGFCRLPEWKPGTTLEGWFLVAGLGPVWLAAVAGFLLRLGGARKAIQARAPANG